MADKLPPGIVVDTDGHVITGMTLRDWFAGQALKSMATWSPMGHGGPHGSRVYDLDSDTARQGRARWAYAQADAMIAARKL